jgi:hypothetical protein
MTSSAGGSIQISSNPVHRIRAKMSVELARGAGLERRKSEEGKGITGRGAQPAEKEGGAAPAIACAGPESERELAPADDYRARETAHRLAPRSNKERCGRTCTLPTGQRCCPCHAISPPPLCRACIARLGTSITPLLV